MMGTAVQGLVEEAMVPNLDHGLGGTFILRPNGSWSSTWQSCSFLKDKLPFGNETSMFYTIIQIKPNNRA